MNKKLSHITIVFLLFLLLGSSIAHGWTGLIATTGDILSTTKWNELVNKVLPIYSTGGLSGNVGIGDTSPGNKLEITHGTGGNSGLRFTNLTSTDAVTAANGKNLSVNPSGDVVMVPELRQRVILAADVINNSAIANTLADITGLSWAVINGTRYQFECRILYTAALATTGSRWTINGPTATTVVYTSNYPSSAIARNFYNGTAYNIPATSNASSAATIWNVAIIEWFITPSANGNIVVRFASEIASSAITAKAGSTCEYWSY